jgi:hypothetical protein
MRKQVIETKISKRNKEIIETKTLGKIISSYISNTIAHVSDEKLNDFIQDEITYGPQIVSIPVPPYRHAFLVDVQPTKIMISDWGGKKNRSCGIPRNKNYEVGWKQYSNFMTKLEKKYKIPVEYYPVNKKIHKKANKINTEHGGGGCSYYIYEWIKEYYPEYTA